MRRSFWGPALLLGVLAGAALGWSGCDGDGTAGGRDVSVDGVPEGCCPIGAAPSCDCVEVGGSPDQPGGCHNVCDAAPDQFTLTTDENGCPMWRIGPGSCLGGLDVGGGRDTGAAADTGEAPSEPDAGG